jgi:2-amino-4-hydroxy-6-hydroxymethyldihydropteridine diphosphokinase
VPTACTAPACVVAYVGLGSNLGDSRAEVEVAIAALRRLGPLRASSLYWTEPLGPAEQSWFVNAVVELRTDRPAQGLLAELQALERAAGRRPAVRWGPRSLDLDLLLYGDAQICEAGLRVPHTELEHRRFVLAPLVELAPRLVDPRSGRTVAELLAALADPLRVEKLPESAVGLPVRPRRMP